MNALPFRRIVIYAAAAVVVLAVGVWTVAGGDDGEGGAVELQPAIGSPSVDQGALGVTGGPGESVLGGVGALGDAATAQVSSTTTTARPAVFVQVAGEVERPGVYEMPAGSRVFEALARAGGVTPSGDEQALPLAAEVLDGARIVVPVRGVQSSGGPGGQSVSGGSSGLVSPGSSDPGPGDAAGPLSLNSATAEQLDTLPGIGPSLAGRIIAYRESHGPFSSVSELDEIPGIGPAIVSRLDGLVVP